MGHYYKLYWRVQSTRENTRRDNMWKMYIEKKKEEAELENREKKKLG